MDRSLVQMVACSPPAARSTSMVISRPVRSTPSRGSPIAPPRQTVTPLMVTSTRSGSKAASVVSVAAAVSASVISSALGVTPLAPLARTMTVSLVERQPSESTRSKETLVACFSAVCRVPASTTASVVRTTSIVARLGASMPAPLAMPPTVSFSIGSRTPMSPVEATATSIAPMPSSAAACSAVAWVSWKPSGPVQALAPPELSTTARARSPASTWRLQSTGAAGKRLVVKTAAAASSGPWLRTTATSGSPLDFKPAATPAAENPWGAVVLTMPSVRSRAALRSSLDPRCGAHAAVRSRRDPHEWQAGGLGQAQGQVGALDRRAPGALGQVVHRRHHHQPPRVGVHGQLQRDGVRAQHLRGGRPLPLRQQVHERLGAVGLLERRPDRGLVDAGGQRRRAGGQDAPAHPHP